MRFDGTDTYPVGVLATALRIRRALTIRHPELRGKRLAIVRREMRKQWHYLSRQARSRNWRAVRNSFNGYLAEHRHGGHDAGRGWTKRAAERRVERICAHSGDRA